MKTNAERQAEYRERQAEKAKNYDSLRATANAKGYVTVGEAIEAAPKAA